MASAGFWIAFCLIVTVKAQTCADGGTGPCLFGCGPTQTCIDDSCCDNTQIVFPTTAAADTTAAIIITSQSTVRVTAPATCVDLKNPSTGVSDCPNRVAYCNNSVYYTLMTQQCPKTCGRCSAAVTTPSPTCFDRLNPSTGVSDCPSRAYLCNDSTYFTLMTQQCPRTCGRCGATVTVPSTTCVDRLNPSTGVSDCPSRAYLCNDSTHFTLMTQQCPRTCGRCSAGK
ncbi:unnamed protein product [Caenorhabditis auriculariae]|uniref:ShKT domain-containing protein n=1 Tax=Caenorhabditis auriculariae TaxID=2777116 RepID=A0A8S1HE50_9PELO|nr:unnamed protein product [Caenorhabditis auriculariae]